MTSTLQPQPTPPTHPSGRATLPPPGLPGLDPAWSRLVEAPDAMGVTRTWHLLDTHAQADSAGQSGAEKSGAEQPIGTLLCVHGNPTWSYLWRNLLAEPPAGWRVIAVDQLEMGYSERTGTTRRLADRVVDLTNLTDAIGLRGPVVPVAHDWGGAISMGWAVGQVAAREQGRPAADVVGVILGNTAVHQPEEEPAPVVLRAASVPGVLPMVTSGTRSFIASALWLSQPRPSRDVRAAYYAPYLTNDRRAGVEAFVRDIPFSAEHPSAPELDRIAAGMASLGPIPVLLLWGPRDPVFSDIYLRDLISRFPQADVHRYVRSSHLVVEDAPTFAEDVRNWMALRRPGQPADPELTAAAEPESDEADQPDERPLWAGVWDRAADPAETRPAVVELGPEGTRAAISFPEFQRRIERTAAGLADLGVQAGDRVALLVPPGVDLAVALYAVWRAGAVGVVVDAGLGLRGMRGALVSAGPRYVIGVAKGLAATRAMGLRSKRILVGDAPAGTERPLDPTETLAGLERRGVGAPMPPEPEPDSVALVAFTSGATGPAKGVAYTHRQLQAQRAAIISLFDIAPADALVAGFGPFALLAPALGIPCAIPDMDVLKPRTLHAKALASAVAAVDASLVFAAPAALANLLATAGEVGAESAALTSVRVLLSAGAPVPVGLLAALTGPGTLLPAATAHTPYGMTECLLVTDIALPEMLEVGPGDGVCVGHAVPGASVAVCPLDALGQPASQYTLEPGVTGEIVVSAPHLKERYDRLWVTQARSADIPGWHRTGDVGHLDAEGRLWVEGRLVHVVSTANGPVTPVGPERRIEDQVAEVRRAAVAGVGPAGSQVVVAVVEVPGSKRGLAPEGLRDAVREAVASSPALPEIDLVAVLVVPELPTDIRHNSKIDRVRVARWASRVLAGGRGGRL